MAAAVVVISYLEAAADMNNYHDFSDADHPDRVAQRVHDLAACCAAKGVVASKPHTKVAVGHQGIRNPHTKLHPTIHQLAGLGCDMRISQNHADRHHSLSW